MTLCWMRELDQDGDAEAEQVSYTEFARINCSLRRSLSKLSEG